MRLAFFKKHTSAGEVLRFLCVFVVCGMFLPGGLHVIRGISALMSPIFTKYAKGSEVLWSICVCIVERHIYAIGFYVILYISTPIFFGLSMLRAMKSMK